MGEVWGFARRNPRNGSPRGSRQSAHSEPPATKRRRISKRLATKSVTLSSSIPHEVPKPLSRKPVSTKAIRKDRLGTLVQNLATAYDESSSWETFVTAFRGRSYLAPNVEQVQHPAAELLAKWRDEGVPALTSSEPWPTEDLDLHIERGCHHSAVEHAEFLREEMSEFIENGFWVVLPYSKVQGLPNLQLSPDETGNPVCSATTPGTRLTKPPWLTALRKPCNSVVLCIASCIECGMHTQGSGPYSSRSTTSRMGSTECSSDPRTALA